MECGAETPPARTTTIQRSRVERIVYSGVVYADVMPPSTISD